MIHEPFQMSISKIRKTENGTFMDGVIEQGILYEGDSIRYGRSINTVKFMQLKSAQNNDDIVTMVYLHYFADEYAPSDKHRITTHDSVRLYIPIPNIPPNFYEGVEKIHYLNRHHFNMPIEDVFTVKGRGVCITGSVSHGRLKRGQRIRLANDTSLDIEATVIDLMVFGHMDYTEAGDNIGLLLKDVTIDDVKGKFVATTEGLSGV